jgi:hypothetical protein
VVHFLKWFQNLVDLLRFDHGNTGAKAIVSSISPFSASSHTRKQKSEAKSSNAFF